MNKWLKRIRGALGIGLTWAAAWGFVGALMGLWLGGPGVVGASLTFALSGFIGGGAFSVVLGLAGRRRTFDEMSLPRFAGLGALAPLLLIVPSAFSGGVFNPGGLIAVALLALLCAGSAAGSLALARMADDSELLEAGEETADIGLTKEERRELLGT